LEYLDGHTCQTHFYIRTYIIDERKETNHSTPHHTHCNAFIVIGNVVGSSCIGVSAIFLTTDPIEEQKRWKHYSIPEGSIRRGEEWAAA